MKLFTSVCPAALMALPFALALTPAMAQSTGSQALETVTVTGTKVSLSGGLDSYLQVPKQQSSITQDFIKTQTAGQTFFQDLNMLPGVNFTNNDAYGTSGGNIRMHGQDGNHIALTLDGMPLNDTGNYAIYTNQMLDPELIGRVTINQGTTDVDSPTAAVTGGTINVRSIDPTEDFSAEAVVSGGTNAFQRYFGMINSGNFGPFDTRGFLSYSYSGNDKYKGPGKLQKTQINGKLYQDFGSAGWASLAFHWNRNRNNSYGNGAYTYAPGAYRGLQTSDWNLDYDASCAYTAPVAGASDKTMTGCSNWYKLRINPSDTGNIRFSSLWHLGSNLTLTADSNLQYVLANGGGSTTMAESLAAAKTAALSSSTSTSTIQSNALSYTQAALQLIGNGSASQSNCKAGVGCDLNGDGDYNDIVQVYRPSTTNTRRWGFNTSLIWTPAEGQTLRAAYTLDYGVHRQTGQATYIDPTNGAKDPFSGWTDKEDRVLAADGTEIRGRDRNSRAILNQFSVDYDGDFFDGMAGAAVGVREPFFKRELNQQCYTQIGSSTAYCTSQAPNAVAADGTVTFAGLTNFTYNSTAKTLTAGAPVYYVPLAAKTVNFNKFLPHLGAWVKPFGDEHFFYANFTKELAAPRTDFLYSSTGSVYTGGKISTYTAFEAVKPETSTSYIIGYKYITSDVNASLALWNQQVKNRLVSSYDQEQGIYTDRNVPGINYSGGDFDVSWRPLDGLSVYSSASYTSARLLVDVPINSTVTAKTGGKQLSEVPNWMFTGRVNYDVTSWLHWGVSGKQVGRRFASDDNNLKVPGYFTMDTDMSLDLDGIGMKDSNLRFNLNNIWNRHYYGNLSTVTCYVPGATGCTANAYANTMQLRSFSVSLTAKF
jgi:Outer membrane receptor for ferrienterochelin and colicins